jgi:3-methyladenine DNA glycosylase AlkD
MKENLPLHTTKELAALFNAEVQNLSFQNTPNIRIIRRKYSTMLEEADSAYILDLAHELISNYAYHAPAYELVCDHKETYRSLGKVEVEALGQGMNSWWSVDSFARLISGPAWRDGQLTDELIHSWAYSEDRWWRRASLVSTVAFNVKTQGGTGETKRTLTVCRLLIDDHDDMVVKAMSWALRALVPWDPDAVRKFLIEYDDRLAGRVKREVNNKLTTGLKYPRLKKQ